MRGTCDVCGANNRWLSRGMSGGCEAWACSGECGEPDPYAEEETWTITVRREWRERIMFAWLLLTSWPRSGSR
jgi:hypothetical protein